MQRSDLCRLLPTFAILAEEFSECRAWAEDPQQNYQGVQIFSGQEQLREHLFYFVPETAAEAFPAGRFSYICRKELAAGANHICCQQLEESQVLQRLLNLFASLREQEILLDQMVYRNVSLKELCNASAQLLGNPVFLHDDWFITLAMSDQVDDYLRPESVAFSASSFVPQAIVDDFKFDNEYLETYRYHTPQIWQNSQGAPRSLYVNLWDGSIYRGRLLVLEINRPVCQRDFLLAELISQHAMQLLRVRSLGADQNCSMDNLINQLLQGTPPDPGSLKQVLRSLNWNSDDQYCVIRLQSQQGFSSAMHHLLHSDLFRYFPKCYILLNGHQQCMILNLSVTETTLPMMRYMLSPLCRDYCLYAGISSPVKRILDLCFAYTQAGVALEQAFRLRNENWIVPFSSCAMDYWYDHFSGELPARYWISPELSYLVQYDEAHGTEYFSTLREYLLQERSIPRTSEALIIHRTTLLYRLKKIQSLVSLDLEDPQTRMYLLLSLYVLENSQ